jgi:signal transduction histidine kinase/CheY-like chemotaxis protein
MALGHGTTAEQAALALTLQSQVLGAIAAGEPLSSILLAASRLVEEVDATAMTGILVLAPDRQRFERALATRAPAKFLDAMRDWPLHSADHFCPCATAILQNEVTCSLDVSNDLRWSAAWRELVRDQGLTAYFSYPIVDPFGTPLGTLFAAYDNPAGDAPRWSIDVLHIAARLAELAFDRDQCLRRAPADEMPTSAVEEARVHRERVEASLTQMQRLEALGQLTAGVAHDFNNLLTVVLGNLDYLERHANDRSTRSEQFARRLSFARLAAEHGAKLIAQLLTFSRRQRLEPKVIDVNAAIADMRLLLQSTLSSSIELRFALAEEVWPAFVDPTQLELMILNLAINARDAMPDGGRLELSTANLTPGKDDAAEELPQGEYVIVTVSDTGSGMSREVVAHAFEPFFTTKDVGKGSGLGLAQVYGFAKQSGGDVRIDSRPQHGTRVHIYLPRATRSSASASVEALHGDTSIAGRCVLLVDDDAGVRQVTHTMLIELGCTVHVVPDAAAALAALRSDTAFDVLVADFAMPGMNGAELARQAAAIRPELPTIIVTGYADADALQSVPAAAILQKPFRREQLGDKIRAQVRS